MARVQRHAIKANIGAETVRLDKPLRGVVAALAQALERTEPEFVHVAMMWLDVIADCRWCDVGSLHAKLTKRMFEQLVPPDASPASRGVPLIPLRRLAANAHGSIYHPAPEAPSTGRLAVGEVQQRRTECIPIRRTALRTVRGPAGSKCR